MSKSLCLSCVLFTLEGREAKNNKYVPIFLIWLSEVAHSAQLVSDDALHILVDDDTRDYIVNKTPFHSLASKFSCKLKMVIVPKPKTLLEGMMWKYLPVEYDQEVFMYCDIDCLLVKPIHSLVDTIPEGTIWIHAEGPLRQHDWGAAFSEEELALFPQNALGLSAGKFILSGKGPQQLLFAQIREMYANHTGEAYYTLEQPFFNKSIITRNHGFTINLGILRAPIVSFNGNNYTNESVFLDMAGEPGNAEVHLEKMIHTLCMLYTGVL